jgi:hypothetical protein
MNKSNKNTLYVKFDIIKFYEILNKKEKINYDFKF